MLHITEDTPPDMLAGAMDLTVHLPNGRQVKMSVERSTPMMDVLVQITTAHHLQLSSHSIQALGIAPSSQHNDKVLPYKPNTPIGTLDTQHIRVIPKGRSLPVPKNVPPGHQPFVSTFRLRVHLPRNQLYVSRVSMNARLEDIMKEVCDEKNLDQSKYEFRHPGNLDQVLDLKLTLNDYQITEIHFVSKGNSRLSQAFSSSDIMALRKDEERKQSKSGGVFNLIFKRSKTSNGSGSLSSDNRSISPTHSDDSRSVTPPGVQQVSNSEKPKAPQRKRRPAPKPPAKEESRNVENQVRKTESGLTICHSRNSSDSSGYHEASILSDNANTSLPRRPQTLLMSRGEADKLNGVHSKSTSNLSSMSSKSKSTSSLAFAGRKKKAPPPPPALNAASSVDNLEASPVVDSPVEQSESLPPTQENNLQTQVYSTNSPPESIASSLATTLSSNIETDLIPSKENSEIVETEKPIIERMKEIKPMLEPIKIETPKEGDVNDLETEWQYQLPSPPTAFRDSSPLTENLTNYESTEPDNFKPDSVITSPELFEKLKLVKEAKSEISENQSEDDKPILNKLSLENLEKRKSLVYNRELATSLKYKDDESAIKSQKTDSISSKRSSVISELEEVINHPKPMNLTRSNSKADNFVQIESSLPNFKITTYDMPKKKINIFEDDSIRSNSETNNNVVKTPEDTNLYKKSEDVFKKPQEINKYRSKTMARSKTTDNCLTRSESFSMSNWVPANPVKRSKSQVGISEYIEENKMSKSNSLFDVSGLQSLEVIRNIQMKLKQEKEIKNNIEKAKDVKEKAKTVSQSQTYVSRGPPSINLGTWSERPKSQISLKEDTDYKFNTANLKPTEASVKPVEMKRSTFKQSEFNGFNVRVNSSDEKTNVSIKVNGSETISSQPSGNVVIKIGGSEQSNNEDFSKRFINHTTAVGYRKPLGNINKVSTRPHSIAHDDVSRLPIVRSVELKKPFKDTQVNTSITQINGEPKQQQPFANSQVYVTSEPIRLNSFNQAPVVKGFQQSESNKNMWNSYKTLPMKPTPKMDTPTTNQNVLFSQRNLRRTESIKNTPTSNNNNINNNSNSNVFDHVVLRNTQNSFNNNNNKRFSTGMMSNINLNNNIKNVEKPPPPPIMPKVNGFSQNKKPEKVVVDPRDELLSAIRDFGGKKGLKAVKI